MLQVVPPVLVVPEYLHIYFDRTLKLEDVEYSEEEQEEDEALMNALWPRAINNSTLIVMVVNMGQINLTLNSIESIRRQGRLDNFFLFCLSQDVCDLLQRHPHWKIPSAMVPLHWLDTDLRDTLTGGSLRKDYDWGGQKYILITNIKQVVVLRLLKEGFSVILTDADVVWMKQGVVENLLGMAKETPSQVFFGSQENYMPDFLEPMVNSGFYLVRPTELTLKLFDLTVANQIVRHGNLASQHVMNQAMDILGMKTNGIHHRSSKFLDRDQYANGFDFFLEKTPQSKNITPFTVHPNYIVGKANKEVTLREFGLWFLTDSNSAPPAILEEPAPPATKDPASLVTEEPSLSPTKLVPALSS